MKNKLSLIFITAFLLTSFVGIMPAKKVSAAAAICYQNLVSPGIVPCSTGVFANSTYNVNKLTYQDDKCYEDINYGGQIVIVETDCGNAKFNSSQPSANLATPKTIKSDCQGTDPAAGAQSGDPNHCGILDYILIATNLLSALVGVVVVAMIIIGGIQYSSAGDDPQKVAAAKSRIGNAILALVAFFFMYAFLQWLIPGGIF